jgi:hypothetical protein
MSERDLRKLETPAQSAGAQGVFDRDLGDPASHREAAQQRAKLAPVENHGFPCGNSLLPHASSDNQAVPSRGQGASSEDPSLPGLPQFGGCRTIVHLKPSKYIDIPYPADYSVRHGITTGHAIIQVPGWFPGAQNYPYRPR